MTFRIAVVQPIANPIGEAEKNIGDAVNFIARAKAKAPTSSVSRRPIPGPGGCRRPLIRRRALRSRRKAWHQCRLRHHRAAQPQRRTAHNLICMAYGHGLRAGQLSAHASQRTLDLHRSGQWWEFQTRSPETNFPCSTAEQGKVGAGHLPRGLYAGGDVRAGTAWRRTYLHAGRQRQAAGFGRPGAT